MPTDSDLVKKFSDLIKQSTPSIVRSQSGISVTQNGQTYEIPFADTAKSISKSTLTKK